MKLSQGSRRAEHAAGFCTECKALLVFIFQGAVQLPKPKEEGALEQGLVGPGVSGDMISGVDMLTPLAGLWTDIS